MKKLVAPKMELLLFMVIKVIVEDVGQSYLHKKFLN